MNSAVAISVVAREIPVEARRPRRSLADHSEQALVMLAAGLSAIYVPEATFPRYSVPLILGIASGAAMIPFSMMKEANPPQVKGTAAGVMNFLVFLTTGVMSPFISHLMVPTSGRRCSHSRI